MSGEAEQTIEATAVEETLPAQDFGALVPTGGPTLAVTPQVQASELVERLAVIREAQEKAMVEDIDYGVIPGTKKPTLLKPGAEKLSVLFQLDLQIVNEKIWGPDDHLTVVAKAVAFFAPTGTRLGYGEGVCTTREKKYAVRQQQRACPSCGKETIFESRKEPEYYCWAKKGGCGAKFPKPDQRITDQDQGEVPNPDLPDLWNTVVKMAEKRARVDVVLAVTGASALFTQDVEDADGNAATSGKATAAQAKRRDGQGDGQTSQATAAQRRKIHALASKLGLGTTQLKAWIEWNAGNPHTDRIEKTAASKLIEMLEGYEDATDALAAFSAALDAEDDRAQAIAAKHREDGEVS